MTIFNSYICFPEGIFQSSHQCMTYRINISRDAPDSSPAPAACSAWSMGIRVGDMCGEYVKGKCVTCWENVGNMCFDMV